MNPEPTDEFRIDFSQRGSALISRIGQALGWQFAVSLFFVAALIAILLQNIQDTSVFYLTLLLALFLAMQSFVILHHILIFARIDMGAPLLEVKGHLERLRTSRLRFIQWSVGGWMFLWLPFLLVFIQAITRVNILPFLNRTWLFANILAGVALLGLGVILKRIYRKRREKSNVLRRLVDALAGRSLSEALRSLEDWKRSSREGTDH